MTGDPWAAGAVGDVRWTGVSLREVLEAAGAQNSEGLQVAFCSPDEVEIEGETALFSVSISMVKALQPDVLLAWEMNGEPLLPEHSFPLRAVVPGYSGVRSANWVSQLCVQDAPADSPIQRKDYKLFPAELAKEDADWDDGLTIDAMPLNSAIYDPEPSAKLEAGPLVLRGWATASGRAIRRVDVSVDGARTWTQAELL